MGWTARKNSFSDGMPLRNERGDVIWFFPARSSRNRALAAASGARALSQSDGPLISYTSIEEDPDFPAGLNGMFHGF